MKKLLILCSLILVTACSKGGAFNLESFDSVVRQVTSLPGGENGPIPVENKMTINVNGEVTEVNVDNATVNYPNVRFDNGQYSFNISL